MANPIIDADSFWKKRLTPQWSTFGRGPHSATFATPENNGWAIADVSPIFTPTGSHGESHGRPRLNTTMGTTINIPGPAKYSPNMKYYHRRIPEGRIASRKEIDYSTDTPAPNKYKIAPGFQVKKDPIVNKSWKVGIKRDDDYITPGPGSYEITMNTSNFPVSPRMIMQPSEIKPPRLTISTSNVDIIDKYNTDLYDQTDQSRSPGPGKYNMEKYPKRLSRGVSISQLLPLREQKEILKPGPGDYDVEKAGGIGRPYVLSSPSPIIPLLRAQVSPSADPDNMTTRINKSVKASYNSEYSFPKKEIARNIRGRVFTSTVQDIAQHHLGAHSPGAYIKT